MHTENSIGFFNAVMLYSYVNMLEYFSRLPLFTHTTLAHDITTHAQITAACISSFIVFKSEVSSTNSFIVQVFDYIVI